ERAGVGWGMGPGGWNDATQQVYPDFVEVAFSGTPTIDTINVFTVQDNFSSPSPPDEIMTFTLYGNTVFDVQYWNGSAWVTVPGGSISGNNKVWRKLTFAPIATTKIRVLVNDSADHNYSRITEIEAFTPGAPTPTPTPPPGTNVALPANGGVATASSTFSSAYDVTGVNNGERAGVGWGSGPGGWNDATQQVYPDLVEVAFSGTPTIDTINVFTVQDNFSSPSPPDEIMTFTLYGNTVFDVQYWNGSAWVTVPGGSISGNNKVWRKLTFSPIATTKIRVLVNDSADHNYSRITEIEAFTPGAPTPTPTPPPGTNVALASNGGVASAASTFSSAYAVTGVNNGERAGVGCGSGTGGWNDATQHVYPDFVDVALSGHTT